MKSVIRLTNIRKCRIKVHSTPILKWQYSNWLLCICDIFDIWIQNRQMETIKWDRFIHIGRAVSYTFLFIWIHIAATWYTWTRSVPKLEWFKLQDHRETEMFSFQWNFHHWLDKKLSFLTTSGSLSDAIFVKITTFPFQWSTNIFLCVLQIVEASRAML